MKVNEFSKKYHVDYCTVYAATAMIPLEKSDGHYEYPEEEIRKAVAQTALRRLAKCEHDKQKAATILKNLGYGTETKV